MRRDERDTDGAAAGVAADDGTDVADDDLAVVMASIDMQKKSSGSSASAARGSEKPSPAERQTAAIRCASCDAENPAGQRFCGSCGAQL